jgi:hypothetical protein
MLGQACTTVNRALTSKIYGMIAYLTIAHSWKVIGSSDKQQ